MVTPSSRTCPTQKTSTPSWWKTTTSAQRTATTQRSCRHLLSHHLLPCNLKLPAFWSDALEAWFAAAEAHFKLRHVFLEEERFCHVTAALDKLTLKKVVHIIISLDLVQPYYQLKEALLASHKLTEFQKVELILTMEPLADMSELCPGGQHNNIFFAILFLQRLPSEIRVLLTHEDHTDLRRLAAHADRLFFAAATTLSPPWSQLTRSPSPPSEISSPRTSSSSVTNRTRTRNLPRYRRVPRATRSHSRTRRWGC